MSPQSYKPGEIVPVSGQYRNTVTGREATCVRGEPFPPGPPGSRWVLVDPTRHKK